MKPSNDNKKVISISTEERKAITDPLYKSVITVLLRHGILKLEGDSQ